MKKKQEPQFDPELIGVFKSILPAATKEIKEFEDKLNITLNEDIHTKEQML